MLVICGYLGLFGNRFSTISAQSLATAPLLLSGVTRRRKRSEGITDLAASYSRFSSDLQSESSNDDQKRCCREAAEKAGLRLPPELEYSDSAVSGTKRNRIGLNKMLEAAKRREFSVVYFHSLSRLARESVITMPLLKKLVYAYGIRVISLTEGIDSTRDGWDLLAGLLSMLHERYVKELGSNVLRGQQGAVLEGFAIGDHCFGYKTEPIEGSEASRRGKNAKPRRRYLIDNDQARWVQQIFHWFVNERRPIAWIVRKLNTLNVPKDHRSSKPQWYHGLVLRLLSRDKYRGVWPWGQNYTVRDPETGSIRQEPRDESECQQWVRSLPNLQIISDDLFAQAQVLLNENRRRFVDGRRSNGRLRGCGDSAPRHLLSQLLVCAECRSRFMVGGTNGKYLFCPGRRSGTCSCRLYLRKDMAERLILNAIGAQILRSESWFGTFHRFVVESWDRRENLDPREVQSLKAHIKEINLKIERLLDRIENGVDDAEVQVRLRLRKQERGELEKSLMKLERELDKPAPKPDERQIRDRLSELGNVLKTETPEAAHALRELVGPIEISEVQPPERKRAFHRGVFRIVDATAAKALKFLSSTNSKADPPLSENGSIEVVIDFIEPKALNPRMSLARSLYDRGMYENEIAEEIVCSRGWAAKLIRRSYAAQDKLKPNGFERRKEIGRSRGSLVHLGVSDQVFALANEGMLLGEIAEKLDLDRNTVTASLRYACSRRDVPYVDGRTRRKSLSCKSRRKAEDKTDDRSDPT